MSLTKEKLYIFWRSEDRVDQEETPGLTFMGITNDEFLFDDVNEFLIRIASIHKAIDSYKWQKITIDGTTQEIVLDIKIFPIFLDQNDEAYQLMVSGILSSLFTIGFYVSWLGVDYETDIDDFFYEDQAIYAAVSKSTGLVVGSDWNNDFFPINSQYSKLLRRDLKLT